MQKIIRIGEIEVEKGMCTVGFIVHSPLGHKDVTHNFIYKMLESQHTTKVEVLSSNKFTFQHGELKLEVYTKN